MENADAGEVRMTETQTEGRAQADGADGVQGADGQAQAVDPLAVAARLYEAFLAHDPQAILAPLHPDLVGEVSTGMPLGVGGRHEGPATMLRAVWAPVFAAYDVRVEAEELLLAGDRVVALGTYRGTERATGRPFEAAFAHVLTIRDGRITSLRQITDTRSWPTTESLHPSPT